MEFYQKLEPILDFEQIGDPKFFVEAPPDWMVLLSDIKGSTQAVQQGRGKDVNMLGASVITLISNATNQYNTISVFGGDGATLLLSAKEFEMLRAQLVGLMRLAQQKFKLELRVGAVPISVLNSQGHKVWVGKYRVTSTTDLAQFLGSGISIAESMIKNHSPGAVVLSVDDEWQAPDLRGLSCRMSRVPSKNGKILSLIVKGKRESDSDWIRQSLVPEIKAILGNDFHSGNPVRLSGLHWKWIPSTILSEIKFQSRLPLQFLAIWIKALFANTLLRKNISIGRFIPEKYKQEVPLQSDFKKYDDALRMVIDCTVDQSRAISQVLDQAHRRGQIFYGVYESDGAVMTCMTRSASDGQHVHFVDGEGCGYSMASVQMKAQMKPGSGGDS